MSESRPLARATLGAIGVVFGDIGTSPLYAFKESPAGAGGRRHRSVLGLLSLIFWSLAIVVTVKYLAVIMRADNPAKAASFRWWRSCSERRHAGPWAYARGGARRARRGAVLLRCVDHAGDLGAERRGRLDVLDPDFERAVLPVTLGVIVALFAIQRRGTARVGALVRAHHGAVVRDARGARRHGNRAARRRARGRQSLVRVDACSATHPGLALIILGAVFLAVTGAEALYADMGHFGTQPVRLAWLVLVWPALIINYFGQGALLLQSTAPVANPFYALAPQALLPALVLLSTAATVIASQATISGAFSVTRQAVQLDLLPRVRVLQTSPTSARADLRAGRELFMFVAVVLFVVGFGSSSALSAAYGASVVGTMLITTLLGALVARSLVELAVVARRRAVRRSAAGRPGLRRRQCHQDRRRRLGAAGARRRDVRDVHHLARRPPGVCAPNWSSAPCRTRSCRSCWRKATKVPGTAVFLVSQSGFVPTALLRNLEHNKVHHEQIVILHIEIQRMPRHDPACRVLIEELHARRHRRARALRLHGNAGCRRGAAQRAAPGLKVFAEDSSFFLGWHLVRARPRPGLPA